MGLMGEEFVWILSDAIVGNAYSLSHNGTYMSYYEGLLGIQPRLDRNWRYQKFRDGFGVKFSGTPLTEFMMMSYDALSLATSSLTGLSGLPEQDLDCTKTERWTGGDPILNILKRTVHIGVTGEYSFTDEGKVKESAYDIVNFVGKEFIPVGHWDEKNKLKMISPVRFFKNTFTAPNGEANTLNGVHLRFSMIPGAMPYTSLPRDGCKDFTSPKCYTGLSVELVEMLATRLKFTYHFVVPEDGVYGSKNAEGEWNGMILDIIKNRTDMIITAISSNTIRKEAIEFSYPLLEGGLAAFVRSNREERDHFFFLRPFDTSVWIGILIACVVVGTVIYFLSALSPYGVTGAKRFARNKCNCEPCRANPVDPKPACLVANMNSKKPRLNFMHSLWLISAALVGIPGPCAPTSVGGRVVLFTWRFFILILVKIYVANMSAFLTLSYQRSDITTPTDLLKQDKYRWGILGSGVTDILLQSSFDPDMNTIGIEAEKLTSYGEGVRRMNDGYFVFIGEFVELEYLTLEECNIMKVGDVFQSFDLAWGLPKDCPYKGLVDQFLLDVRENGVFGELLGKYYNQKTGDSKCKGGSALTMSMGTLGGLFFTIPIGICVALGCVIIEYFYVGVRDSGKEVGCCGVVGERVRLQLVGRRQGEFVDNKDTDV
eukprot:sb/3462822/